jgi:hypothetical protein
VIVINYLSSSNTMVHKIVFMIDLSYIHYIKQLRDEHLYMGCMTHLYTCLYDIFEMLRDIPQSVGCTCPKELRLHGF